MPKRFLALTSLTLLLLGSVASAHPVEQKAAARLEYGFTADVLSFQIRRSLEFYIERRWGLNRPGARLERC